MLFRSDVGLAVIALHEAMPVPMPVHGAGHVGHRHAGGVAVPCLCGHFDDKILSFAETLLELVLADAARTKILKAQVAELVDALVSGTSAERRGGSSPLLGTKHSEGRHSRRLFSWPA